MTTYSKIASILALIGCFIPHLHGMAGRKQTCCNKSLSKGKIAACLRQGSLVNPNTTTASVEDRIPALIQMLKDKQQTLTYEEAQALNQQAKLLLASYKKSNPTLARGWNDRLDAAFALYRNSQQQAPVVQEATESAETN